MSAHVWRVFVPGAAAPGEAVELGDDDRAHLERVLRYRGGERIELADAAGALFAASYRRGGSALIERLLSEPRPASGPTVWLALAGNRGDLAVEKLTELGVVAIGALASERAKGAPRPDRWRRVAEAAARQAKRTRLPELLGPRAPEELFGPGVVVLDHEASDATERPLAREATLLVGPEAGWSEAERVAARAAGTPLVRLGEGPVLRSETAAIAAAALCLLALR